MLAVPTWLLRHERRRGAGHVHGCLYCTAGIRLRCGLHVAARSAVFSRSVQRRWVNAVPGVCRRLLWRFTRGHRGRVQRSLPPWDVQ